jgi:hypothetical protein
MTTHEVRLTERDEVVGALRETLGSAGIPDDGVPSVEFYSY